MNRMKAAELFGGYGIFLLALVVSFYSVHELIGRKANSYPVNVNSTSSTSPFISNTATCLPLSCNATDPLIIRGLGTRSIRQPPVQVPAGQGQQELKQRLALAMGQEDAIILYVVLQDWLGDTLMEPGYCGRDGTPKGEQEGLAFAYAANEQGKWTLQLDGARPWTSLGLMRRRVVDMYLEPIVIELDDDNRSRQCWRDTPRAQRLLMLHYRVKDFLEGVVATRDGHSAGSLPGELGVRHLDNTPQDDWVMSYPSLDQVFAYKFCQLYRQSVDCPEQDPEMTQCISWGKAVPDYNPHTNAGAHYHYVIWTWLLITFIVPLCIGCMLDTAIFLLTDGTVDESLNNDFTSLNVLQATESAVLPSRWVSMPHQLRPLILLFRKPDRRTSSAVFLGLNRAGYLLTFLAFLAVAFFLLAMPALLQMPKYAFGHLSSAYSTIPADCDPLLKDGLHASALAICLIFLVATWLCVMSSVPGAAMLNCEQTCARVTRLLTDDGNRAMEYLPLLPTYPVSLFVQLADKLLLFYAYRTVLALTQITWRGVPLYVSLPVVSAASLVFGLLAALAVFFTSQYALLLQMTLTALLWLHPERFLFAVLLFRLLVWPNLCPAGGYRRFFPVVCACFDACLWAVTEVRLQAKQLGVLAREGQGASAAAAVHHVQSSAASISSSTTARQGQDLAEQSRQVDRLTRDSATRTFLSLYHLATTLEPTQPGAEERYQAIFNRLRTDIGREMLDWAQAVILNSILACAIFILANATLSLVLHLNPLTPIQTLAIVVAMTIACLLPRPGEARPVAEMTRHFRSTAHSLLLAHVGLEAVEANAHNIPDRLSGRQNSRPVAATGGGVGGYQSF